LALAGLWLAGVVAGALARTPPMIVIALAAAVALVRELRWLWPGNAIVLTPDGFCERRTFPFGRGELRIPWERLGVSEVLPYNEQVDRFSLPGFRTLARIGMTRARALKVRDRSQTPPLTLDRGRLSLLAALLFGSRSRTYRAGNVREYDRLRAALGARVAVTPRPRRVDLC
jgi:hypothetical protein